MPSLTQFSPLISDASRGSSSSSHRPLSNLKRGDDATLVAMGTGVGGEVAVGTRDEVGAGVDVGRGVTVGLGVWVGGGVAETASVLVGAAVDVGRLVADAVGSTAVPGVAVCTGTGVSIVDILGRGSSPQEDSDMAKRAASRRAFVPGPQIVGSFNTT